MLLRRARPNCCVGVSSLSTDVFGAHAIAVSNCRNWRARLCAVNAKLAPAVARSVSLSLLWNFKMRHPPCSGRQRLLLNPTHRHKNFGALRGPARSACIAYHSPAHAASGGPGVAAAAQPSKCLCCGPAVSHAGVVLACVRALHRAIATLRACTRASCSGDSALCRPPVTGAATAPLHDLVHHSALTLIACGGCSALCVSQANTIVACVSHARRFVKWPPTRG